MMPQYLQTISGLWKTFDIKNVCIIDDYVNIILCMSMTLQTKITWRPFFLECISTTHVIEQPDLNTENVGVSDNEKPYLEIIHVNLQDLHKCTVINILC
jgi:hypothetical protein